jgi:hypothetical protein
MMVHATGGAPPDVVNVAFALGWSVSVVGLIVRVEPLTVTSDVSEWDARYCVSPLYIATTYALPASPGGMAVVSVAVPVSGVPVPGTTFTVPSSHDSSCTPASPP